MSVSSFKGRKVENFSRRTSDSSYKHSTNESRMPEVHEADHLGGSSTSGSTPSLPLSIPYYYIANHSNSFDTMNILNTQSNQPQYSNTSHLNSAISSPVKPGFTPQLSTTKHLLLPQHPLPAAAHDLAPHRLQQQQQQQQQQQPQIQSQIQSLPLQQHQQSEYQQQSEHEPRYHPQGNMEKVKLDTSHARTDSNSTGTLFNQVPKRFSQFILDQQNPYMAQRLDHLSMNLISLYSGGTPSYMESHMQGANSSANPHHNKKTAMKTGSTTTSSNPRNKSSTTDSVNRDILESMGSQATIFSTRPQDNDTNNNDNNLKRRRAVKSKEGSFAYRLKLRIRRIAKKMKYVFVVKRKKTVKPIGPTEEKRKLRNFLRRSNRKAAAKKKTRDVSVSELKKSMKKSLSMRLPKSKSKPISISAPTQNLELGGGSELVPMDSKLKMRAGLQDFNENEVVDLPNEEDSIRRKTLSPPAIVPSANSITRTGKFTTRKAPPPPAKQPQKQKQEQQQLQRLLDPEAAQLAAVTAALQKHVAASKSNTTLQNTGTNAAAAAAAAANARALSDHLPGSAMVRKSLHATVVDQLEEETLVEAWKNYLSHVIASRIKLRQEINFYQSLKKEHTTELNYKFGIETEDEQSRAGSQAGFSRSQMGSQVTFSKSVPTGSRTVSAAVSEDRLASGAVNSGVSSRNISSSTDQSGIPRGYPQHKLLMKSFAPTMASTADSDDDDDDNHSSISILDPAAEEFNRSFANRHSMLGEMLDYNSDATSIASSQASSTATETESRATHATHTTSDSNVPASQVISNEDLGIGIRYGTVIRRTSPSKRSANGSRSHLMGLSGSEGEAERSGSGSGERSKGLTISVNNIRSRPISLKRSQGFRVGLNSAASSEVF